jgi:type I restriction enzyme S subunit
MKSYPKYKTSENGILGMEIPEHWDMKRLKYVSGITNSNVDKHSLEDEEPVLLCNYTDVYYNEYIDDSIQFMEATATTEEIRKFTLKAGDVLITKDSEEPDDIAVAAYVESPVKGLLCGYHLALIRPDENKIDGKYLFRAFKTSGINEQFQIDAQGITRYGLSKYGIDNSLFPVPPLEEQKSIASFLDQKTSKIDKLVSIKEKQIELLKEERTAIINQAVTKGLNPKAKMKDSSIEWLGEIPKHWEELKLKYCSDLKFSNVDKHSFYDEIPVKLCNYTDVYYNENIDESIFFMEATATQEEIGKFSLHKGDVIVTKDSEEWTDIAVPSYVSCELNNVLCGYHLALIRPYNINGKYLSYSFRSRIINHQLQILASGITRYGIGKYDLDNSIFLIPPIEEQKAIADYIDNKTVHIDKSISDAEKQIDFLKEYRTALISEAVTGKIDVRGTR